MKFSRPVQLRKSNFMAGVTDQPATMARPWTKNCLFLENLSPPWVVLPARASERQHICLSHLGHLILSVKGPRQGSTILPSLVNFSTVNEPVEWVNSPFVIDVYGQLSLRLFMSMYNPIFTSIRKKLIFFSFKKVSKTFKTFCMKSTFLGTNVNVHLDGNLPRNLKQGPRHKLP